MLVDAFDFHLPEDRIAQAPVHPRDAARLLHVAGDQLADRTVMDLTEILRPGDVMVFNDTRVIPARLSGLRLARPGKQNAEAPGAKVEITLHQSKRAAIWKAFARPAKKLMPGDVISFADDFSARVTEKGEAGEVTITFDREGQALDQALERYGIMPLPPYIKRDRNGAPEDQINYQTLFADRPGAVAAPTAGLHFTDRLMDGLKDRGVQAVNLTLHVGAGTFLPVKADDTRDHKMHSEWGEITSAACDIINQARADGGRVIATGTTCLRTLETAARDDGWLDPFQAETDIFITPGYRFKVVDCLMTNFHLPRSTLFMLVSAFCGLERMKKAYGHAIANQYRFYSYGDACFLERDKNP